MPYHQERSRSAKRRIDHAIATKVGTYKRLLDIEKTMKQRSLMPTSRCPRCHHARAEPVLECPNCGLTFAQLDAQLPRPPAQTGHVNDMAALLTPDDMERLRQRCEDIQRAIQVEIVVATVKTTTPLKPAEYAFWLANCWDIGGTDNRGLLILLALRERRIESEVGYGLESLVSDEESLQIFQMHTVPLLQAAQYAEGLYCAVDILGKALEVKQNATQGRRWRSYFA